MWAHVFRTEESVLETTQIMGFMYGSPTAFKALGAFRFIEPQPDGRYRVKGADRLLGIRQARRAGGQAAKANLIPGPHRKKAAGSLAGEPAGDEPDLEPENTSGSAPADFRLLHRQPTTDLKASLSFSRAREDQIDPSQILDVYAHYRQTFNRRHLEPNSIERDTIEARLREGWTPDELKKAISGLSKSKLHTGKGYTALKYALASRDEVERCMHWDAHPPDGESPPRDEAPTPEAADAKSPAEEIWAKVLEQLWQSGKTYAASFVEGFRAEEIRDDRLVIAAPDAYAAKWVKDTYSGLLNAAAELVLGAGVVVEVTSKQAQEGPQAGI
jgi:hypothetical protein